MDAALGHAAALDDNALSYLIRLVARKSAKMVDMPAAEVLPLLGRTVPTQEELDARLAMAAAVQRAAVNQQNECSSLTTVILPASPPECLRHAARGLPVYRTPPRKEKRKRE